MMRRARLVADDAPAGAGGVPRAGALQQHVRDADAGGLARRLTRVGSGRREAMAMASTFQVCYLQCFHCRFITLAVEPIFVERTTP